MFRRLVEETRGGIKSLGGVRPLDALVPGILNEADFRSILQPYRCGTAPKSEVFPPLPPPINDASVQEEVRKRLAQKEENKERNRLARIQMENDKKRVKTEAPVKPIKQDKPIKTISVKLPPGLRGMTHITKDKKPICYGYNLGTCDRAQPGQKCAKGMHVCMRPGCGKPHSLTDNLCQ